MENKVCSSLVEIGVSLNLQVFGYTLLGLSVKIHTCSRSTIGTPKEGKPFAQIRLIVGNNVTADVRKQQ